MKMNPYVPIYTLYISKSAGYELAQVVGCPWMMRDSGGSLSQNRWQGDLGLTAVGQDGTGGGRLVNSGVGVILKILC